MVNTYIYYFISCLIGLLMSLVYWLCETFADTYIMHTTSFFLRLYPQDTNELQMRFMTCFFLTTLSIIIAIFFKKKVYLTKKSQLAYHVLNTMHEGCIITNDKKEIVFVNKHFETITGYLMEEVLGKNPRILSSGKQDALFYQSMWSSIEKNGTWDGEIWNRTKSGELYPEWVKFNTLRDKNGAPTHYFAIFDDITLKKERENTLLHYSYNDPLTSLPNRRLFMEILSQSIKEAERNKEKFAVLFLDVDRFKLINDQYGHLVGDQFLCNTGAAIKALLRKSDILSRFGGDEFVILLHKAHSTDAIVQFAKKILSHLNNQEIIINSHPLQIHASIGGSVYPDDALNATDLIKLADSAMYTVKMNSRNGVAFINSEMTLVQNDHELKSMG